MKFDRKVEIIIKGNNLTLVFDDAEFPGSGTAAYNQLLAKQTSHATEADNGSEAYIPFHAVRFATLTVDGQEVVLVDSNCASESPEELEPTEPTNPGFGM